MKGILYIYTIYVLCIISITLYITLGVSYHIIHWFLLFLSLVFLLRFLKYCNTFIAFEDIFDNYLEFEALAR